MRKRHELSNDFRDMLIQWLEVRASKSTCTKERTAYLETIAFIKTGGLLK
jgi:hypothetical protein